MISCSWRSTLPLLNLNNPRTVLLCLNKELLLKQVETPTLRWPLGKLSTVLNGLLVSHFGS